MNRRTLPTQPQRVSSNWFVRPLAAFALLLLEYLSISLSFESLPQLELFGRDGSWLAAVQMLGPAVVAWATALWLLGAEQARVSLQSSFRPRARPPGWSLLVNLGSFALLFLASWKIFGVGASASHPTLWLSLWVASLLATVASALVFALGAFELRTVLRELARPLALASLLGLVALAAGLATRTLWKQLADWTLASVTAVLSLLVGTVVQDLPHAVVGTRNFFVEVSPMCSGYEGIGIVAVFVGAYLLFYRKQFRFPHVLLLLALAMVLVWALNVVRIVALIGVGHMGYPEIALGGFHSKAGWLISCALVLGTVWLSQRVDWFLRQPARTSVRTVNPSLPFLFPLLAIVATTLVTGLFITDFDYLYPIRVVVGLLVLGFFWKDYRTELSEQLAGRALLSWQAIALGVLVFVLWIAMAALLGVQGLNQPPAELVALSPAMRVLWLSARVLGATVAVPIAEELAFRGFLLRRLISADFSAVSYRRWSWPAVLISSLAFALVHQAWIAAFFAGCLYAYAQYRRGLLSDAILAHAVTNALIAVQVLLGGQWSLW